jgi:hypothetical protein
MFFFIHFFCSESLVCPVNKVVADITWRYHHVKLDLPGGHRIGFIYVDPVLDAILPPKIGSMCQTCKSDITWLFGWILCGRLTM